MMIGDEIASVDALCCFSNVYSLISDLVCCTIHISIIIINQISLLCLLYFFVRSFIIRDRNKMYCHQRLGEKFWWPQWDGRALSLQVLLISQGPGRPSALWKKKYGFTQKGNMGLPNQGNTCSRVSLHEKHPRFYFVFAIIVFIIGVTFLCVYNHILS